MSNMSEAARDITWGEGLVVAAFRTPRGLRGAVEAIQAELGPAIGTRNTFGKLLRVTDPAQLNERDRLRAWLLLVALRQEPDEWGVPTSMSLPRSYDEQRLRAMLPREQRVLMRLPRADSNRQPAGYILALAA